MIIDEIKSKKMIGKYVLAGITYRDLEDNIENITQVHGVVLRINENKGLVINQCSGKGEFNLPPLLEHYEEAGEGEYNLKSTGEVVTNPDYIASYIVYPPGYEK